ncbi:MAG: hypothetical protein EOM80_08735 [Erysipelotrichia bacterium]|nr:hypothetical protein [Erysipelotrichia bacterium]
MKEKRYPIEHVQKMIDISPAELQKMIRKNARVLHLHKEDIGDGKKEVYLDEESFHRLLFIKQLERGGGINGMAACELIKTPRPRYAEPEDQTKKFYTKLISSLEAVSAETTLLKTQLQNLMIKYDHVIKQLNISQAKNICLEKEIGTLRNREAALMGHLRQSAENRADEELDENLVN